jgi:integrase/recombinase XerD
VKILSREDRAKLIREAPTLQDRLIIELLDETGGRRGELWKLRIKDVQFEEVSGKTTAILRLDGKTGVRNRRIYGSVADLRQQINDNPHRENPDMTLFYEVKTGEPFSSLTFYRHVKRLGWTILKKNIHPHMFRHTRATEDCKLFTDREMMKLFGWKRPDQVTTYTHISMKDVDDKDLVLHGLKSKEEILRPLIEIVKCQKCGEENAPIALYCAKCGEVLGPEDQLTNRLKKLEEQQTQTNTVLRAMMESHNSPKRSKTGCSKSRSKRSLRAFD